MKKKVKKSTQSPKNKKKQKQTQKLEEKKKIQRKKMRFLNLKHKLFADNFSQKHSTSKSSELKQKEQE